MLKIIKDASVLDLLIPGLSMEYNTAVVHRVAQVSQYVEDGSVIFRKSELRAKQAVVDGLKLRGRAVASQRVKGPKQYPVGCLDGGENLVEQPDLKELREVQQFDPHTVAVKWLSYYGHPPPGFYHMTMDGKRGIHGWIQLIVQTKE